MPCHAFFQFYVAPPQAPGERGKLSCQLYQRSADIFLFPERPDLLNLGASFLLRVDFFPTIILYNCTNLVAGMKQFEGPPKLAVF